MHVFEFYFYSSVHIIRGAREGLAMGGEKKVLSGFIDFENLPSISQWGHQKRTERETTLAVFFFFVSGLS